MAAFFKKILNSLDPDITKQYEITLRKSCYDSHTIACYHSNPDALPVIPWCSLVVSEDEEAPLNSPFVQLVKPQQSLSIKDIYNKHKNKRKLKAVLIAGKVDDTFRFPTKHPILVIPVDKLPLFEAIVGMDSTSTEPIHISSVPLTMLEKKLTPIVKMFSDDDEDLFVIFFKKIREGLRGRIIMSTHSESGRRIFKEMLMALDDITIINAEVNQTDCELLVRVLSDHDTFEQNFYQDFPIYIAIGCWFCSKVTLPPKILNPFILKIFQGFRSTAIKNGLEMFLSKPDFELPDEFRYSCIFMKYRIADGLLILLGTLQNIHQDKEFRIREAFFAVSLAKKLYVSSQIDNYPKKIWHKHLTEPLKKIPLTRQMLEDLQAGLQIMNDLLKSNPQIMFKWKHLYAIFSHHLYPPDHIRVALELLSDSLTVNNDNKSFLAEFLRPILAIFNSFVKKNGPSAFPLLFKRTSVEVVNEGFQLIDHLNNMVDRYFYEESGDLNTTLCEFIDFFVSLINIRDDSAVDLISDISQRQKWYTPYSDKKIMEAIEKIQDELSINDFVKRMKATKSKSNNKMTSSTFIHFCRIPNSLKDPGVIEFIEMYSSLLNKDRLHLLNFLKKVRKKYYSLKQFFVDLALLKPDKDGIFTAIMDPLERLLDEMAKELENFEEAIPSIILAMMVILPDEYSYYHEKYSNYILKKFTEHCSDVRTRPPNALLQRSCEIIENHYDPTMLASIKITFAWKMLNKVAEFIITKGFEVQAFAWLDHYGPTLVTLVQGYLLSKGKQTTIQLDHLTGLINSLQDAIQYITCCTNDKEVTHTSLSIMKNRYENYVKIWQLLSMSGIPVDSKFIDSCLASYDECIKQINHCCLSNLPRNLPAFKLLKAVVDVLFEFKSILWFKLHHSEEAVHQLVRAYYILCKKENTADFSLQNEIPAQLVHQSTDAPISGDCVQKVSSIMHITELLEGIEAKHYVYIVIELRRILREFLGRNQTHNSCIMTGMEISDERHKLEQCASGKASVERIANKISTDCQLIGLSQSTLMPAVDIGNSGIDSSVVQSLAIGYNEQLKIDHQAYMYLKRKLHQTQEQFDQTQEQLDQTLEKLQQSQKKFHKTQEKLDQTEEQLYRTHEELHQTQDKLHQTQARLDQTQEKLQQSQEQFHQTQDKLHQTQERVDQTQVKLQQSQEELQQNKRLFLLHQKHVEEVQKNQIDHQQEVICRLRNQITALEENWRVSHNEVTLTQHELGRGGWGVIWIGQFREQKVAIKQMHKAISSQDFLDLLHREINTMAQLRHPNLLQFIGAVLDHPSGTPMIITEIMDMSLRKAYEDGLLTPTESCLPICLGIMRDVAVGLNYLHCLPDPIIHRDVSSANVLLESRGNNKWKTKISDFGSANKAKQAMTRAMGAAVYSAPESVQIVAVTTTKQTLTTKMDVFSYGVLLCELLNCEFPTSELFPEMLHRVELRSRKLCELIVKAIETSPTERPTMKQVIEQLN